MDSLNGFLSKMSIDSFSHNRPFFNVLVAFPLIFVKNRLFQSFFSLSMQNAHLLFCQSRSAHIFQVLPLFRLHPAARTVTIK